MINILGLLIFVCLLFVGGYFLKTKRLTSWSYVTYILALCLLGLGFYGFDRLKEINLKDLKLVLEKAEKVKKEIYAKENELKQTSIYLAKLLSFSSATNMRLGDEDDYELRRNYVRKNCEELLTSLNVTEEEKKKAFEIFDLYKRIDKAFADKNDEERIRLSEIIKERMKNEIGK